MKKIYLLIGIFCLMTYNHFGQGATCQTAMPFCAGGSQLIFPNVTGQPNSNQVACLAIMPNPKWFTLQIADPGALVFQITQSSSFDANGNPTGTPMDVDFVLWGPFNSFSDYCSAIAMADCPSCPNSNQINPGFYPFGNIVDCSYSESNVESMHINGALSGQLYVVLVTNFYGDSGFIKFVQTNTGQPGAGSTDCVTVCPLTVNGGGVFCQGSNTTLTATISAAFSYSWTGPSGPIPGNTQSIVVTQPGTYTVVVNKPGCVANATASATYTIAPAPDTGIPNDLTIIEPETVFNLTLNTPIVQNGDAFLIVDYHTTLASANDGPSGSDLISNPFSYAGMDGQTIYVSTEDNNACIYISSFVLHIGPAGMPSAPSAISPQYFNAGDTVANLMANGQNIQWYTDANNRISQLAVTSVPLSLTTPLQDGQTYHASQTVNGIESTSRTAVMALITLSGTSFAFSNLNYFPNPVKDLMTVSNASVIDELEVISIMGQVLMSKTVAALQTEMDLSHLSKAVYFLRIYSEGNEKVIKIVKE